MPLASVLDHKRVADAILAGDAAEAERAMRAIIQEAMDCCWPNASRAGRRNARPV
ncbi:MAG: hypothetical protein WDM79_04215 [Terricaulis sp.]